MRQILSIGFVKGVLAGLAGTGTGMSITVLARVALGIPAWNAGPVFTIGIISGVITYLAVLGAFSYWWQWATGAQPQKEVSHPPGRAWRRYFSLDTNHKIIGVQYLVTALFFLPFAVALQLLGRLQLVGMGSLVDPETYETVISEHGIVMLFIVVLPAIAGLMNYLVPLMIGTRDMAFPRLNAFSYWLVPPAGLLTLFSLAAGGFDTGWTVYPPLSASYQPLGMNFILLGVFIGGFSSILTAINVLTTIFKMRAPGMIPFRMPIFVWISLATTGLTLVFTQFVAMVFLMVLLERVMGMAFFRPEMGGSVLLYQYLFWFYSHPAVYVFVLPGLGVIAEILPVYSRKPLLATRA